MTRKFNDERPVEPRDSANDASPAKSTIVKSGRPAGRWKFWCLFTIVFIFCHPVGFAAELPSCTSPYIVQQVEKLIAPLSAQLQVKTIDGHREIDGDHTSDIRHGLCVIHTADGDFEAGYSVQWKDEWRREMLVSVSTTAPYCAHPQIVQLVKDAIGRKINLGSASGFEETTVSSIDHHRQVSMDRAANVRHCRCVVNTAAGDIPSKYFTKWNRETGQMEVGSEM